MHFLIDTYKIKVFFFILLITCATKISASLPDTLLNPSAIITGFQTSRILNSSPNYSLVFDDSGIMFLGQENKISAFNGKTWYQIFIKGEILLAKNSANTIFFAGENNLGFLSPDSSFNLHAKFINNLLPEKLRNNLRIINIKCSDKTTFFQSDTFLFSYNLKGIRILDSLFLQGNIFKCRNNIISLTSDQKIKVFRNDKCLFTFNNPYQPIKEIFEHEKGYLLLTRNDHFLITDSSFNLIQEISPAKISGLRCGLSLRSGELVFSDKANNLYLLNKNGKIVPVFNTSSQLPNSSIIEIAGDEEGNIWILQEKFVNLVYYPSSISILLKTPEEYGSILDLKNFNNKIYIASDKGLFYLNPSNNTVLKTSLSGICFKLITSSIGLFAITADEIFIFRDNNLISVFKGKMFDQQWDENSRTIIISQPGKIESFKFDGKKITKTKVFIPPVSPQKILVIDSALWISDGENIYMYENLLSSYQKQVKLTPREAGNVTALFNWQNKLHFLQSGRIYSLDEGEIILDRLLTNEFCNGDCINFQTDNEGNIYSVTLNQNNNYIVTFGSYSQQAISKIPLPSYITIDHPSFNHIGNGLVIFSPGKDIFLHDPRFISRANGKFETIIDKITAGESELFKGISYDLFRVPLRSALNNIPYKNNTLAFELSSTSYAGDNISFQYYLTGEDKIWSDWSNGPILKLSNLSYGNHDLKIRSKNYLGESSVVTNILFSIEPPFYRNWWAYLMYLLLAGISLFIAYKTYLLRIHHITTGDSTINVNYSNLGIPIIKSKPASNSPQKKYDFFSNIDDEKGKDKTHWDKYEMVTVLFSDIQGFTKIAESMNPELLIDELDRFFFHFDSVVEKYDIEKIKTIGDAYMAAGGIPKKKITSPVEVVLAALEMQNFMKQLKKTKIDIWDLRIGIHSGPVIAGIIGHKKRSFDIWGDTVNTASRMESTGEAGKVNISSETYKLVKDFFICEYRGKLPVKYKGNIDMYFVNGLRPELSINLIGLPNRKFFIKLQLLRLTDLEEFIFQKLETELSKNLYFHNLDYTRHLYDYAGLLAKAENFDFEETLLIRTSALMLNTGFTSGFENQENRSATFAREILPDYNYSEKQINQVCNLILSTKWPPEPKNNLEKVLIDAKMEFIGRADYIRLYKLIFLEQNQYLKSITVNEFKKKQIDIISRYEYFTESARRLREVSREEQISEIKNDEWK